MLGPSSPIVGFSGAKLANKPAATARSITLAFMRASRCPPGARTTWTTPTIHAAGWFPVKQALLHGPPDAQEEDVRQISRWKAMRRHVRQVEGHCEPGDTMCRKRQRQALLHQAYGEARNNLSFLRYCNRGCVQNQFQRLAATFAALMRGDAEYPVWNGRVSELV